MEWLSELGPTAGAVAVVLLFLKFISDQSKAQAGRDEMFSASLNHNTSAMKAVARATTKAAEEAEKRNGHLAELAIENKEATLKAISLVQGNVKSQHVDTQVVDRQTIKRNNI